MKLSKTLTTVVGAVAIATSLAACSGEPLSTREKGTLIGTGVGAAGGAVVGAAVGAPLAGAAIGGVAGGATGFAVGNHIQNERNGEYVAPPVTPGGPQPQPADNTRRRIGKDVAVQVRRDYHIKLVRRLHEAPRKIVDDELFVLYFRIPGRGFLDDFAKQAVRFAQHVVLRRTRQLALAAGALALDGELTGELGDAPRRALGDHFDRVDAALGCIQRRA